MNGIEKITEKIELDAKEKIDQVLAQAKAEAAEITARYEAQAAQLTQEILDRSCKQAREREERVASVAQLECRKAELAAKQEVIEEAFRLALDKLVALPQEQCVALLAKLAVQASSTGREKLVFSQTDRPRLGKAVVMAANQLLGSAGQLTLAEENRAMSGGFILTDGTVEVNCSFDTLVRLQRAPMAGAVAKVLFG